jgi:hypothetical protein
VSRGSTAAENGQLVASGDPAGHDLMILREGTRAGLVSGPDGHRFLMKEEAALLRK